VFAKAERLYQSIRAELERLLPSAELHHVGSTAVPGTLTKGDLDVVVRVSKGDFAAAEQALAERFERNTGSDRSDEFSAFMDAAADPELGIQLVAIGGVSDVFLAWRDLLLSDAAVRREYDELKSRFEGKSMEAYREAKANFIVGRLAG
jgi:GrpB-like predicted nucleotidyltransferase (UPF0157 family)